MQAVDAKTKGIGFANVRAFAEERFGGAQGWGKVVAKLAEPDRRELESVVPVGWYSLAMYARLIRVVDQVHGHGDLALIHQLGRFEAERDLTTIQRLFLRMANPAYILEKTSEYWRRFHDSGTWVIERQGATRVRAFLDDWGQPDAALCRETIAYVVRAWELVGARNVRMDHPHCRSRGEKRCEFLGRWNEAAATG